MEQAGLTREQMDLANERRHWLAMLRIHKLFRQFDTLPSINALAKMAHAAWRTVKAALHLTWDEVLAGVRQAFRTLPTDRTRDIEIKRVRFALQQKAEEAVQKAGRSLGATIKKCLEMAKNTVAQIEKPGSEAVKSARKDEERHLAQALQIENSKQRAMRSDGPWLKLKPHEQRILRKRLENPGSWSQLKAEFQLKFQNLRKRREQNSDSCRANSQAYLR
jgi:hypothetical protein